MRLALVVVVTGCGRFGFSAEPADSAIDTAGDASLAPVARYSMDEAPVSSIVATDPEQDAPCGPCPTSIAGRIGNAVAFDGALRVALPNPQLIGLEPFTVALWINPDQNQNELGSIVSKPAATAGLNNALSLNVDAGGIVRYESSLDGSIVTFPSGGPDLRGAWHHVAASWDGTRRRLHLDGVLAGDMSGVFDSSNLAVGIGADLDDNTAAIFYRGGIDELRFYARALSDDEITALATP